jgi:hypothetical protein
MFPLTSAPMRIGPLPSAHPLQNWNSIMVEMEASALAILGAGGTLLGILGLMRPQWVKHWTLRLAPLAITGVAAALAFASGNPLVALLPLGLVGFWTLVSFGDEILRAAAGAIAFVRRPRLAWGALLVASPLFAVAWSFWTVTPEPFWDPPTVMTVDKTEVAHGTVRTDAGQTLRIIAPVRRATAAELQQVKAQTAIPNLICTDSPGVDYNCHGWVFTGGRYWITGLDVARVLKDNGYVPVTKPAPGDVIIYYNSRNEPVHTGLVRASDDLGIIIESKWDVRGRYIHLPEAQDYSDTWVYYHTDRPGHILAGIEREQKVQPVSLKAQASD